MKATAGASKSIFKKMSGRCFQKRRGKNAKIFLEKKLSLFVKRGRKKEHYKHKENINGGEG
jgi:hypothetical protein